MINRIWFGSYSIWWWLLLPFSWLYSLFSESIRLSYKLGIRKSWRAPVPVVIVGNITVGGNGKTPFVIWLVEQLQRKGIRVGVVSRGYGGKTSQYPIIVSERTTTTESGDEPVLIYQRIGVSIAVAPKRSRAIQALLKKEPVQIIISDDGLQHYSLKRDLEIVIIDGIRRFGNGFCLPAGPMREKISRLRSVDVIVVNGGLPKDGEIAMHLRAGMAINLLTNERCNVSLLKNLVAMAGIGYPLRFFSTLEKSGAKLVKRISLRDHKTLQVKEIDKLIHCNQTLIMTEKDAVKYRSFAKENWWYLPVYAELNKDKSKYLIQRLISLTIKIVSTLFMYCII